MNIYVARHGQTTGDVEDRYGGDYDDHLTDVGKEQAAKLAEKLANKGIKKLYTSPLIRAQETAGIVAASIDITPEVLPEFKERNSYGILTGMIKADATEKYPDEVALLSDPRNCVTGAEDYVSFQRRIQQGLVSLSQENIDTMALITHGGPIHLLFRDILKLGEVDIADCAMVHLQSTGTDLSLLGIDGISYK